MSHSVSRWWVMGLWGLVGLVIGAEVLQDIEHVRPPAIVVEWAYACPGQPGTIPFTQREQPIRTIDILRACIIRCPNCPETLALQAHINQAKGERLP